MTKRKECSHTSSTVATLPTKKQETIFDYEGRKLFVIRSFLEKSKAKQLRDEIKLLAKDHGHQECGMIMGKPWKSDRISMQFKTSDSPTYVYNGSSSIKPIEMSTIPLMEEICDLIQEMDGRKPNLALVMIYPEGSVGLGEHSDDERGLTGSIYGLTLGAERDVVFVDPNNRKEKRFLFTPPNGSLYCFNEEANRKMKHSVPIRKKVIGERICITFRFMSNNK